MPLTQSERQLLAVEILALLDKVVPPPVTRKEKKERKKEQEVNKYRRIKR